MKALVTNYTTNNLANGNFEVRINGCVQDNSIASGETQLFTAITEFAPTALNLVFATLRANFTSAVTDEVNNNMGYSLNSTDVYYCN